VAQLQAEKEEMSDALQSQTTQLEDQLMQVSDFRLNIQQKHTSLS
jgi:hypothetical protein